jgi:hypothetical protein
MIIKSKDKVNEIKSILLEQLKEENAFWSYDPQSVTLDNISDEQLKDAWKKILVPEGEYLYTLNRFFAWYYFKAKNPDAYLKSLQTRHLNALFN